MKYFILTILIFCASFISAQKDYFQQKVDFTISATLNDYNHQLDVDESVTYTNNSPQSLDYILFELYANAFSNTETPFAKEKLKFNNSDFYFAPVEDLGGYKTITFTQDGKALEHRAYDGNEIVQVDLSSPLQPGQTISIDIKYKLQIPYSFSRLGHVGQTYQLTQWFPKPAVYDNAGWHPLHYHDIGEFYAEFGDYKVDITLPQNYIIGGTGVMNIEEQEWLKTKSDETKKWLAGTVNESNTKQSYNSSDKQKTVHFEAQNVHDFALFANKDFKVLNGQTTLSTGETIELWSLFEAKGMNTWKESIELAARALNFYSDEIGAYPYPQYTAVQSSLSAGAGMEYPMATVIGDSYSVKFLDRVLAHEIGHSWFYGILASNERDFAWMDEGLNSYYEHKYMDKYYTSREKGFIEKKFGIDSDGHICAFLGAKNARNHPSISGPTFDTEINYAINSYERPALALELLEAQIGADNYAALIRDYFQKWQFKHPQPADFKAVVNDYTTNNDWFFTGFMQSNGVPDYALKSYKGGQLTIKNKGRINAPVHIIGLEKQDTVFAKTVEGFEGTQAIDVEAASTYKLGHINSLSDHNPRNNRLKTKGLFKRLVLPKFTFLGTVTDYKTPQIIYTPLPGYNTTDGVMLGMQLNNHLFYDKKLKWSVTPFYGFKSKNLVGFADVNYSIFPSKSIRKIEIGLKAKRFSYNHHEVYGYTDDYLKIEPYVNINLDQTKRNASRTISLRLVHNTYNFGRGISIDSLLYETNTIKRTIGEVAYTYELKNAIGRTNVKGIAQVGENFGKIQGIFKKSFAYEKGRYIYFNTRATYLITPKNEYADIGLLESTGSSSLSYFQSDYMLDELLMGRNERELGSSVFAQNIFEKDAHFKTLSNNVLSDSYMISFGLKADLPVAKLPLQAYAESILYPVDDIEGRKVSFGFTSGIALSMFNENIEVYFPIFTNKNIRNSFNIKDLKYFNKIMFKVNLQNMNLNKIAKDFDKMF